MHTQERFICADCKGATFAPVAVPLRFLLKSITSKSLTSMIFKRYLKSLSTASLVLLSTFSLMANTDLPISQESFGMPYYTGTVYPTPQDATYHETLLPAGKVLILPGQDYTPDAILLQLLQQRIVESGGEIVWITSFDEAAEGDLVISVGEHTWNPVLSGSVPQREQGYLIEYAPHDGRDIVVLRGYDSQGLVWAVSSLIQLITPTENGPVLRPANIYDYPAILDRGYFSNQWGLRAPLDEAWYILFSKMNTVVLRRHRSRNFDNWRNVPESTWSAVEQTARVLSPLGIKWFFGYRSLAQNETQVNCSSEEDLAVFLNHARRSADMGGNFYLSFDDIRFPLHPDDQARFGSAREADSYMMARLYEGMQETHPEASLWFGQPFYWGPTSPHAYDESREEYLTTLGERLPPEVGLIWTGGSVKSGVKTPEQVQWFTELTGRKPIVFQNGFGSPNVFGYHYGTDPLTSWEEWHYDGFFDDVEIFMANTGMPLMTIAVLTLADYLWNPDAYDAERSVREACMKLLGPEVFPKLQEYNRLLASLNMYGLQVSPVAARDMDLIRQTVADLDEIYAEIQLINEGATERWTNFDGFIEHQRRLLRRLEQNPDLSDFVDMAEGVLETAINEADFNEETDVLLTPVDFVGSMPPRIYGVRCEPRAAAYVHGQGTGMHTMRAPFEVDPFPPAGDYILLISGQDNDRGEPARIRIRVGDTVIHEGENGFVRHGWSQRSWRIPAASLDRYSTLTIENLEEGSVRGPPWFMLNYAILRKTAH